MKQIFKISLAVSILSLMLNSCDQKSDKGVKVTGTTQNQVDGELVILGKFEEGGVKPVDTINIAEDGSFEFYVDVEEPTFYMMNFYNRQQFNLIIDTLDTEITIELEGNNPSGQPKIEGSKHTAYLQAITGLMNDQQQDVQDLNQQGIQARMDGDEAALERLTQEYYKLVAVRQAELKKYLWNIMPSPAVFYGLQPNYLKPDDHFTFYDSIADRFKDEFPNHYFTKSLITQVEAMRGLAVGAEAPEISLPNPDGEIVTLSSLQGKYVLIDFWAAWCKPCRAENPNVVRLYNEYNDENFEILGVSLDRNREAWLGAIAADGLKWKHVSDLKYFNSEAAQQYQIEAIPATYLIGPDGKIIAKNLRGAQLEAKLKEIFG